MKLLAVTCLALLAAFLRPAPAQRRHPLPSRHVIARRYAWVRAMNAAHPTPPGPPQFRAKRKGKRS